jgi:hypothetical protein
MSASNVNKEGADWLLIRSHLNTLIEQLQQEMLSLQPPEQYHAHRGAILFARGLIEWVEPSTPPKTSEDTYGISDPEKENYA